MVDVEGAGRVLDPVGKAGYEQAFEDTFDGEALDQARWLSYHLPQWSCRHYVRGYRPTPPGRQPVKNR
jgi:hypothetical protein